MPVCGPKLWPQENRVLVDYKLFTKSELLRSFQWWNIHSVKVIELNTDYSYCPKLTVTQKLHNSNCNCIWKKSVTQITLAESYEANSDQSRSHQSCLGLLKCTSWSHTSSGTPPSTIRSLFLRPVRLPTNWLHYSAAYHPSPYSLFGTVYTNRTCIQGRRNRGDTGDMYPPLTTRGDITCTCTPMVMKLIDCFGLLCNVSLILLYFI